MPPSRYKVVEKGRRLVVVDRLTGEQVQQSPPAQPQPSRPDRMAPAPRVPAERRQTTASGRGFTTQPWYDNRAPRDVILSDNAQMGLLVGGVAIGIVTLILFVAFGFPVLIIGAVLLANVRKGLRAGVTNWLDGSAQD